MPATVASNLSEVYEKEVAEQREKEAAAVATTAAAGAINSQVDFMSIGQLQSVFSWPCLACLQLAQMSLVAVLNIHCIACDIKCSRGSFCCHFDEDLTRSNRF